MGYAIKEVTMKLVRLATLLHNDRIKIRKRQMKGTMSDLVDSEGYICYDADELKTWKPKKAGRPSTKRS